MGQSFELLPIEERIQQYREMADATLVKAQRADDPEISARYLELATNWHALAQQLEAGNPDPEVIPNASLGEPISPDNPRRAPLKRFS